uniref:Ig-like domain-containing protein n=1 Tax=Strigops habroptila TaxID=2489341 RepID=A0A672UJY9_STRHB
MLPTASVPHSGAGIRAFSHSPAGLGSPSALTCSARLTVQPSVQPLFTRKLEDVDVVEGRTARFDCMISGTPTPTVAGLPYPSITWFHNGSRIDSTDDRKMMHFVYEDNECSLVVLGAAEPDSGVYTCTAKNLAGEVSCKAELVVRAGTAGRPPTPGGRAWVPSFPPTSAFPSHSPARC